MTINLPGTLTILAGVLTTPVVALLIYLFSRRAQLRQLNATSDATLVTSAATLVTQLQTQILLLTDKLAKLETERSADRTDFVEQLNRAHSENSRISVRVAQLQTDIDIAHRQIEELRDRLPRGP
jgi:predicted  nucleic acid-binding Zn-ribbon protein